MKCLKVSALCYHHHHHTALHQTLMVAPIFLQARLALAQGDPSTALQVLREGECLEAEENCLLGLALWQCGEAGDRREAYRQFVKVSLLVDCLAR